MIPLMSSCLDFAEEITELQAKAAEMGALCLLTPKYHCEMAGEGIEYAWGVAKARYRAVRMSEKKTLDSFRILVRKCLARSDSGLPLKVVRRFGVRARAYICAYYAYETTNENGIVMVAARRRAELEASEQEQGAHAPSARPTFALPTLNYKEIQKLMKCFKVHRGALDFDKGFILRCIVEIKD